MNTKDLKTVPNDVARFLGSTLKRVEKDIDRLFSLSLELSRKFDLPFKEKEEPKVLPVLRSCEEKPKTPQHTTEERLPQKTPSSRENVLSNIAFQNKAEEMEAEVFFQDLRSLDRGARMQALGALKKLSLPIASQMLEKLLSGEKDPFKIIEALNALTGLNNGTLVPKRLFLKYAEYDHPEIRSVALRALSKYHDEESFGILAAHAQDSDAEVRRQVLNCLCWVFDERCLPFVLKATHDPDHRVRKTASQIIGVFKAQEGISSLITLLSDSDKEVQKSAILSLKKITGEDFGFKATEQKNKKDETIEKWRSWWRHNQNGYQKNQQGGGQWE